MNWKASYQNQKMALTTTNIQLENFNIEHVPTESANGGVLLYIRKAINYKLRPDLMIYKRRELESFFIEIIKKNSKNVVVGYAYIDSHVWSIVSSMTNI